MAGLKAAHLAGRSVVAVAGPAAGEFLQGLVTADIAGLAPGDARNAALLTPQGKILFEFQVRAGDDGFLLDCPADTAADLAKRLMFYRLRAKVDIVARPQLAVVAFWDGEDAPPVAGASRDPRLAALGFRAIVPAEAVASATAGCESLPEAAYDAHRIACAVAEFGSDYASGEVFPHEANLDQLGGVDFDKGCYVGQEVVSRMQHRGTARSRFVPVAIDGPPPPAGTPVEAGGKPAGTMGSSAADRGLALLRLDRISDALAAGAPVRCGTASLSPARPGWATFAWPGGVPAEAR